MKEEKDKKREYHRLKRSIEFARAYDKEAYWDRLVVLTMSYTSPFASLREHSSQWHSISAKSPSW